ncbi:MAG TPA: TonB-dependent receptor [Steroidobacteraceae bacterium]|nr:TonB-dependent receptor [Steroidobacteraceae bacterium]
MKLRVQPIRSSAVDEIVGQLLRRAQLCFRPSVTGVGLALGLATSGAYAFEVQSSSNVEVLEEIVVTAQLREETLQSVPISAQVIQGDTLQRLNLNSLSELSHTVPEFHVGLDGRTSAMYLRGIGSGNNGALDQSVGTFVDDIYHGRSRASAATFLDLARVEILKGPQSIFFGDNAIAGALNIVTNAPGNTFDASARASYGQFNQYAVEGAAGGPVTDTFGIRVAATVNGERGWLHNVIDDTYAPDETNKAARVTLSYQPSSAFDAKWKFEYGKDNQTGGIVQQMVNCPPPAPFAAAGFCSQAIAQHLPTGIDNNNNAFSPGQDTTFETGESVLTANYYVGDHTLTSVSGYYGYSYDLQVDGDGLPQNLLTAAIPEHFHQFSQELRLASATGQTLEYLGGLYFHDARLSAHQFFDYFFLTPSLTPRLPALVPFLPLSQDIRWSEPEKTYSVFASATWNVTESFKASAGLRASEVEKSIDWNLRYGTATEPYAGFVQMPDNLQTTAAGAGLGTPGTLSDSRTDRALMPSAKLQYQIASNAMGYLSYARGFKAGGFNGTDTTGVKSNLAFQPEYVNDFEAGLKTTWLDRRVLLDLNAFLMKYSGLQLTGNYYQPNGAVISLVKNAATSQSAGVEMEAQWLATRDLRFSAEVAYLDAHYVSYPNAGTTLEQQREGLKLQDLSGKPTSLAPRWTENISGTYSLPLWDDYHLTTEVSGYFSSRYFLSSGTDDPLLSQNAYVLLNARLAFEAPDNKWNIAIIGKNLTDRDVLTTGSALPTSLGTLIVNKEMPRSVAAQFSYRF